MQKKYRTKNNAAADPTEFEGPTTPPPLETEKVLILGDVLVTGDVEVETRPIAPQKPKTAAEIRAEARVQKWGRKCQP